MTGLYAVTGPIDIFIKRVALTKVRLNIEKYWCFDNLMEPCNGNKLHFMTFMILN